MSNNPIKALAHRQTSQCCQLFCITGLPLLLKSTSYFLNFCGYIVHLLTFPHYWGLWISLIWWNFIPLYLHPCKEFRKQSVLYIAQFGSFVFNDWPKPFHETFLDTMFCWSSLYHGELYVQKICSMQWQHTGNLPIEYCSMFGKVLIFY